MVTTLGVFRSSTDDAAAVVAGETYNSIEVVSVQIPDTVGPWLDVDGVEYPQNSLQLVVKPSGGVIAAADPITIAEFALVKGGQGARAGITQEAVAGSAQHIDVAFNSGALNQGYSGSNNVYLSPEVDVVLTVGSVQFTLDLYQQTTSLESGTRCGGQTQILKPDSTILTTFQFDELTQDTSIGYRTTGVVTADVTENGTYRIRHLNPAGAGAGNRNTAAGNLRVGVVNTTATPLGIPGTPGANGATGAKGDQGRSVVQVHRSDGVTAIGGTVYNLDHAIYEFSEAPLFEDLGLVTPPPGPSYKVQNTYEPAAPIAINNTVINTNFDLTTPNSRVTFYFKDSGDNPPWPAAVIHCKDMTDLTNSGVAFFIWNHSGGYMTCHINGAANKAVGAIRMVDQVRAVDFIRAEFEVLS